MLTIDDLKTKINFSVSFSEPQAHYTDVNMNVKGIEKDFVDIKMPVWAPGSYLLREFSKNIEAFKAEAGGKAIPIKKIDKNTWRIYTGKADFDLNYRVYCFEISVRTSFIDDSHAFLSPTGIFMYVDGMINHPVTVQVGLFKNWNKISTGLSLLNENPFIYYAPDFDVLYDSPIEIGNQDIFEFTVSDVIHEVAMYGGGNYDKERLKKDIARIVEEETFVFGENPNERYTFIVHNYSNGNGGLEHLNSTVLGAVRNGYTAETSYLNFLRLVAHEYFHLWNVKRLRPESLGPFNYDSENYTTDLWIAEGFTAYYDKLIVMRAGFQSRDKYLEALAADINAFENLPGKEYQSVSESSFDTWIKLYRQNENSKNSTISYYVKGALLALLLDLKIIQASRGVKRLDDIMRDAYITYYKKEQRGYSSDEFRGLLEKNAGIDLSGFYEDYVHGIRAIDYNEIFEYAGLRVEDTADKNEPYLGAETSLKDGKVLVVNVLRGSGAWNGGINVNDEIIAVNGNRVLPGELDKIIAAKQAGDLIKIEVSRDAVMRELEVLIKGSPLVKYRFISLENPSAAQLMVREKWLG